MMERYMKINQQQWTQLLVYLFTKATTS
ncbi:unnamed protein product, partial [Rotaria sordida]